MLPSFCKTTVVRKRARLVDRRGTQVWDWDYPEETCIRGCSLQNQTTSTDKDGRTLQITNGAVLYADYGADIKAGDRIEHNGAVYEIAGSPMPVVGATGRISHLEIPLSEWKG